MRELDKELKELRLYGMAGAWEDLVKQGGHATLESSRWLLEHLLQAEAADRAMRSISYQMHTAKFPVHRDLAGFDFECSPVGRKLIEQLAGMAFTEQAHNVVLVGGPGTGKTHLATAIGVAGITRHGSRVRFYSTVDLVNALEQEKAQGKAGRIAASLQRMDLVILDELGSVRISVCEAVESVTQSTRASPPLQAIPLPGLIAQRSTQAWFSSISDQLPALCMQRVDASWQTVRTA